MVTHEVARADDLDGSVTGEPHDLVPFAAGQAGGDGAVARGQRGAGARSSLTSAEVFTAGAVSGRAPPRRARALRPGPAPDARGRRTTRRRSCTRPRCPTAGRRTSRSPSRP